MAPFDRMWKLRQALRRPSGRVRCTEQGCHQSVAIRCVYADRRQRVCGTTWCIRHGAMFNDSAYCRRHASTVAALSNGFYQLALPDLDNRAPSLVGWMSGELDAPIRVALRASAPDGDTHARRRPRPPHVARHGVAAVLGTCLEARRSPRRRPPGVDRGGGGLASGRCACVSTTTSSAARSHRGSNAGRPSAP